MRQALAHSIDRRAITTLISYPTTPAYSPLPPSHAQNSIELQEKEAVGLFEKALQELGMTRDDLPTLTLLYPRNELEKK